LFSSGKSPASVDSKSWLPLVHPHSSVVSENSSKSTRHTTVAPSTVAPGFAGRLSNSELESQWDTRKSLIEGYGQPVTCLIPDSWSSFIWCQMNLSTISYHLLVKSKNT
jgi:hypothetical protein